MAINAKKDALVSLKALRIYHMPRVSLTPRAMRKMSEIWVLREIARTTSLKVEEVKVRECIQSTSQWVR